MSLPKRFGALLRSHRLRCGFSQEYLAEKAGVSIEAIGALERGTRRAPYRSTLTLLVSALQLDEEQSREIEAAASQARARVQNGTAPGTVIENNLPAQLSTFIGRDVESAELRQLIRERRLVTVLGAGGIGKTRIAQQVAKDLLDGTFEGVSYVDLAPVNDEELVGNAILSALSLDESPKRDPLDTLASHLKAKRMLLVIDNCEHVIRGVARTVATLLQRCELVHVLATSRELLGIDGERLVRLPTLSVPSPEKLGTLTVDEALEYCSIALFVERAIDADNRFRLTQAVVPTIAEICARLDGIALAIEIAAARVNMLSLGGLIQTLNERFLILSGGKREAPRHRTIRAMLDWSYQLLDRRDQRVFRRLSVFVDGFSLELATALFAQDEAIDADEMLELLGSLVDKSLVQYETRYDVTWYRFLESTRQYANVKLRECAESANAARSHALAMLDHVSRLSSLTLMSDQAWKAQASLEIENWRAALQWAFSPDGDVSIGQGLAASLASGVWFSQRAAEGCNWIRLAIESTNATTLRSIRAKLEFAHATMLLPLGRGQTAAALEAAGRALKLYEEDDDRLGMAAAKAFIGERLVYKHRLSEAEDMLQAALSAGRAGGASKIIATAVRSLAVSRAISGDLAAARQLNREAVDIYEAAGCRRKKAVQEVVLAEFEFQAGAPEKALQLSLASAQSLREYHESHNLANVLSNAAAYSIALNRFEDARTLGREALVLAADGDSAKHVAWAAQHLAAIAALGPRHHDEARTEALKRAARVLGFVDRRLTELEQPRDFTEKQEYDRLAGVLRRDLGAQLDGLLREGARQSLDAVLEELSAL
jgi:predicted ATPase/DNA-binding XRE family transcriptional regulator